MLAKRKKPTRAAHAVNTLAHEHPEEVGSYLDLAADMRAAQIAAARDDRARDELRTRDRARREQLAALLARVPDDRDDVERALTTALVDTEVSDAVRAGTLERIPDTPSGFDAFAGDLGDLPAQPRERAADRRRDEAVQKLEEEIAAAEQEVDARTAAVDRGVRHLTKRNVMPTPPRAASTSCASNAPAATDGARRGRCARRRVLAAAEHAAQDEQEHDGDDLTAEDDAIDIDGRLPLHRVTRDHVHTGRFGHAAEAAAAA